MQQHFQYWRDDCTDSNRYVGLREIEENDLVGDNDNEAFCVKYLEDARKMAAERAHQMASRAVCVDDGSQQDELIRWDVDEYFAEGT